MKYVHFVIAQEWITTPLVQDVVNVWHSNLQEFFDVDSKLFENRQYC